MENHVVDVQPLPPPPSSKSVIRKYTDRAAGFLVGILIGMTVRTVVPYLW